VTAETAAPTGRPGLRELKRRRTREAIQAEAVRLFADRGYEATTCEEIAAAAEISPATFFRYFPTKEDVVLTDDYDALLVELLRSRPAGEPPLLAVQRAMTAGLDTFTPAEEDTIRRRARLIFSVPALRARLYEQQRVQEAMLAAELAPRLGADPEDLRVRVVAAALTAALVVAVEDWATAGGSLATHIDDALATLERELAPTPARQGEPSG
jgi:AcrR family transcriptional regulator